MITGGRRTFAIRSASADRRNQRNTAGETVQVVAFSVGDGEYAVDIMRVKEIINPVPVTRVPKAPPFIEGVVELRGAILPIIDMRKRFDLPTGELQRAAKFVIAAVDLETKHTDSEGAEAPEPRPESKPASRVIVGLVVDAVWEPLRVARSEVRPAPLLAGGHQGYFSGVIHHRGHIVMLVNLDAVLSSTEKITLSGLRAQAPLPAKGERDSDDDESEDA